MDEAVELANASEYSLAASVWTQDVNNAIDVSARIRAGQFILLLYECYILILCRFRECQR